MKKERPTGFMNQVCSKCGVNGHTKPGSQHRRCGGSDSAPIKDKDKKRAGNERGSWG